MQTRTNEKQVVNDGFYRAIPQVADVLHDIPFKLVLVAGLFFFRQLQMGWAAVRSELMKLSTVLEFRDQAPRVLRKDSRALGNTLVTFTNKK
ncbi:unnamed protein product [Prunus armeniaca]